MVFMTNDMDVGGMKIKARFLSKRSRTSMLCS